MKFTYLILLLPFLLNCSNNTTNQEQSNRIKELENRIQKLESINSIAEEGSLAHIIQEFGDINITQEGEFFIYDGDKYIWNGNEYEWVYDYEGKTKKSERSEEVKSEKLKEKGDQDKNNDNLYSRIPEANWIRRPPSLREIECAWCTKTIPISDSYVTRWLNNPRVQRIKENSYLKEQIDEIIDLNENGEGAYLEQLSFEQEYGMDFCCSRKCANEYNAHSGK